MDLSPFQSVELFHLLFLKHLGEKLDKKFYTLKGGCNLRFYFRSIRYSEDLDMDVKTVAKETLRAKVQKIFEAPSFLQTLAANEIEINQWSAPKQTEMTQRWKISLSIKNQALPMPTKLEFSRRNGPEGGIFEPVDPQIIHAYRLYPILLSHYAKESAFLQKIEALAHRREVQTRDVFDIKLLIDAGVKDPASPPSQETRQKAMDNAGILGFKDFKSQVVAFLAPEYQAHFAPEKAWRDILAAVLKRLESIQS